MNRISHIRNLGLPVFLKLAIIGTFFLSLKSVSAQNPRASINRDSIKIGEEVLFNIEVEADTSSTVVFPEADNFGSLEVFNSKPVDSVLQNKQYKLNKTYSLTQFNAGRYTIPALNVNINGRDFQTDSLNVLVGEVEVDTTEQGMYPIKKSMDYEGGSGFPFWILWILLGMLILAALWFLWKKQKLKQRQKQKLPPYEAAIKELEALEKSESLQQGNYKNYYSSLTASVKRYLDEKVEPGILEKTTDEVILRIRTLKNQNKLYLKEHVIKSLEAVLRRADLTKFAGHPVDKLTAQEDRQTMRDDIDEFDRSIAPPSEEELKRDLEYQKMMRRKRQKRNLKFGISGGLALLILSAAVFVLFNGWEASKELVFGNQAEGLLEKEWITSEYGSPGISLTTPKVLIRQQDTSARETGMEKKATSVQEFAFGKMKDDFQMNLKLIAIEPDQFSKKLLSDHLKGTIDNFQAKNITQVQDSIQTIGGVKGTKIQGKLTRKKEGEKMRQNYTLLYFGQNESIQQILMYYKETEPAKKIARRIENAIEFKQNNP